jgi:hypothetical protein
MSCAVAATTGRGFESRQPEAAMECFTYTCCAVRRQVDGMLGRASTSRNDWLGIIGANPKQPDTGAWILVHTESFNSRAEAVRRKIYYKTGRGRDELDSRFPYSDRRGDRPRVQMPPAAVRLEQISESKSHPERLCHIIARLQWPLHFRRTLRSRSEIDRF